MTAFIPILLGSAVLLMLLLAKILSAPKCSHPPTGLAGDDTAEPVVSKQSANGGTSPMPPSFLKNCEERNPKFEL